MQPIITLSLIADAAAPAASQKAGAAIVVLVFAIVLALAVRAVRAALRRFKGEGGCCGSHSGPPPGEAGTIGPAVARRELALGGLHCMKCVSRVKTALEAIPGVAADVTLDPQRAIVRMDRQVPDEALRKAVETQGFQVVSVA